VRPSRWPIRARLAALYAAAFLAAGVVLVAVTYWLVSRSLTQHSDSARAHPESDARLAELVRDEIDTFRTETLNSLLTWSVLALVGALVLAVALGWVLAGRALRPLHQVTETATRIADRSLHERIALTGPDDEVKELADTIDEMLERLDRSFGAQRRFVANASHELRTPLAVNRTMLEVAVGNPDVSDDLKQLAPRLLVTSRRSERLVEGLLTLARSEQQVVEHTAIDLAQVAAGAVEQERHEALQRRITLATDLHPAPTTGSPVLIERLAANLVQNAVRHSPPGGEAVVRTRHAETHSILQIDNPGDVLRPDEIDELFEPFRRGNGRTSSWGVGLGLSIVRSVAQAHGGRVFAHPRNGGGLIVRVELPTNPERATVGTAVSDRPRSADTLD
jgi:signal transduction histidine kinase